MRASEILRRALLCAIFACAWPLQAQAATSFNAVSFRPATDQGQYLTIEQSQTLGQWGYALGLMAEFSNDSVTAYTQSGTKLRDVVEYQMAMHAGATLGLFDWLNAGLLVGFIPYQQFNAVTSGASDNGARMGEMCFNLKGRILDNTKYPVGLAVVPFVTFPTGNDAHYTGNGKVTGGGVVVVESPRLWDRFSAALNVGAQARKTAHLSTGTSIGTQFLIGAGANYALLESLDLIAEFTGWTPFEDFWKNKLRNLEGNGAVRWKAMKGLAVTAGGGAGILNAVGAPDYRIFASVAYRHPAEEKAAPPPPPEEVVIRTNMVHFEFDKSRILPKSYPILDKIANLITTHPEILHVTIEGHTDAMGTDAYNEGLSDRRANSVMQYMEQKGVPASKLTAVGKGESVPIADNSTKAGRAQNRRVEFHLEIDPTAEVRVEQSDVDAPTFLEQ